MPNWKLRRALNIPKQDRRRRVAADGKPTKAYCPKMNFQPLDNLDTISENTPDAKAVPAEGYAQRVMGYPESHKPWNFGESENWDFSRP